MKKECEDCNGTGNVHSYTCGDGCCVYYDACETCDGIGEVETGDDNVQN